MEVEARGRVGSGEVGGKDKNRRERRRTWKRGERMQATTGMRGRMPRDVGDDSVVEIQGN